jgi:hypothetical protein
VTPGETTELVQRWRRRSCAPRRANRCARARVAYPNGRSWLRTVQCPLLSIAAPLLMASAYPRERRSTSMSANDPLTEEEVKQLVLAFWKMQEEKAHLVDLMEVTPQTWRSAWESLPGMVTGAWKTIRWVARTSSSTSTLSQEASRWTFQGRGHRKVRGAVERQALDVPGGQKPGDQGYLLPRLEGKEVAGHGQTSSRTQPHRLHEVRRRLRTARGERKDRSPRRPRYLILGCKEGTGTRLLTFTW